MSCRSAPAASGLAQQSHPYLSSFTKTSHLEQIPPRPTYHVGRTARRGTRRGGGATTVQVGRSKDPSFDQTVWQSDFSIPIIEHYRQLLLGGAMRVAAIEQHRGRGLR